MDRFRSLPIGRGSVLFAKIAVELARMLFATAVLMVVAVLVGFHITHWGGLLATVPCPRPSPRRSCGCSSPSASC